MKEVPVKIEHEGAWVVLKVGITEDRLVIPRPVDREVLFKDVTNLEERKNVLLISTRDAPDATLPILSVEKVLRVMKRLILSNCNAYRLADRDLVR